MYLRVVSAVETQTVGHVDHVKDPSGSVVAELLAVVDDVVVVEAHVAVDCLY